MDKRELNTQNMDRIMNLSKSINSDHYKTVVLKKALKSKNISKSAYASFMSTLDDVNSDHYTTEIVKELLNNKLDSENFRKSIRYH